MTAVATKAAPRAQSKSRRNHWLRVLNRDKYLYLIMVLPTLYFALFHYVPMYGVTLAFKDFKVAEGILGSPWVGLKHFEAFLSNDYSYTLIYNTVVLRLWNIAFSFPCPIILALLLNEIRHERLKSIVQTSSYLPHFISLVVVCGMIVTFLASDGPINSIITYFGGTAQPWLQKPEWFRPIYTISDIWQSAGWESIIYLAALSGISIELYEVAMIDGANRWQRLLYVTIPGIAPTVMIMFLLRVGQIMTIGLQKVLLLYSGATYETADILGTYIYRRGIMGADFSFATSVELFQSLVGLIFIVTANSIAKRLGNTSLW